MSQSIPVPVPAEVLPPTPVLAPGEVHAYETKYYEPTGVEDFRIGGEGVDGSFSLNTLSEPLVSVEDGFKIGETPADLLAVIEPGGIPQDGRAAENALGIAKVENPADPDSPSFKLVGLGFNDAEGAHIATRADGQPAAVDIELGQELDVGRQNVELYNKLALKMDDSMSRSHLKVSVAESGRVDVADVSSHGSQIKTSQRELNNADLQTELSRDMHQLASELSANADSKRSVAIDTRQISEAEAMVEDPADITIPRGQLPTPDGPPVEAPGTEGGTGNIVQQMLDSDPAEWVEHRVPVFDPPAPESVPITGSDSATVEVGGDAVESGGEIEEVEEVIEESVGVEYGEFLATDFAEATNKLEAAADSIRSIADEADLLPNQVEQRLGGYYESIDGSLRAVNLAVTELRNAASQVDEMNQFIDQLNYNPSQPLTANDVENLSTMITRMEALEAKVSVLDQAAISMKVAGRESQGAQLEAIAGMFRGFRDRAEGFHQEHVNGFRSHIDNVGTGLYRHDQQEALSEPEPKAVEVEAPAEQSPAEGAKVEPSEKALQAVTDDDRRHLQKLGFIADDAFRGSSTFVGAAEDALASVRRASLDELDFTNELLREAGINNATLQNVKEEIGRVIVQMRNIAPRGTKGNLFAELGYGIKASLANIMPTVMSPRRVEAGSYEISSVTNRVKEAAEDLARLSSGLAINTNSMVAESEIVQPSAA